MLTSLTVLFHLLNGIQSVDDSLFSRLSTGYLESYEGVGEGYRRFLLFGEVDCVNDQGCQR